MAVIVFSQFAGTSLWFASNAIMGDLQQVWVLPDRALGYMTSAVLFGFISGTLLFAFFNVSDRFSPRLVFFTCSVLGALINLCLFFAGGLFPLLALRFTTGVFLAGIYPVGIKIAAGWYRSDLGKAIGFLVGALVLGHAFPFLLKAIGQKFPWEALVVSVSALCALGGVLMLLLVPDGPYTSKGTGFDPAALGVIFRSKRFRASALGYFGHMWELYGLWTFVPVIVSMYAVAHPGAGLDVPFWVFCIIAAGAGACAGGGLLSVRVGSAKVAFAQLSSSGACCVLSPLLFYAPPPIFLIFLLFWGAVVVGDSPQFSALNARNAPQHLLGSALTIVNCIGFSITIASVELLNYLSTVMRPELLFLPLAIGPVLGLIAMSPLLKNHDALVSAS